MTHYIFFKIKFYKFVDKEFNEIGKCNAHRLRRNKSIWHANDTDSYRRHFNILQIKVEYYKRVA